MLASYRSEILYLLRRFATNMTMVFLLAAAIVVLISLVSYNPLDASGNVMTEFPTRNWMGQWGAYGADFLFQWVGMGAFALPIIILSIFNCFLNGYSLRPVLGYGTAAIFFLSFMQPARLSYPNALVRIVFAQVSSRLWVQIPLSCIVVVGLVLYFKPWRWLPQREKRISHNKKASVVRASRKLSVQSVAQSVQLPGLELLKDHNTQRMERRKEIYVDQLQAVLEDFGVRGSVLKANPGPIVTLYEFEPSAGVKSSRVISLADDIARSMSALSARVAVISGKNLIGIELSNVHREMVYLKELFSTPEYQNTTATLPLVLGKDIAGKPVIVDLAKMPHLLVAGTTGSGKSVGINSMILSLLYKLSPDQCKLIMIDPKMLELSVYDGIPHLLSPVVTEPKKAILILKWVVQEMENRYRLMSKVGVRNIAGYQQRFAKAQKDQEPLYRQVQTGFDVDNNPILENQELSPEPMPFIIVVVDEMADLMLVAGKELEILVQRLAQMARAAGIHIIMATQRPSVDVITGTIKANFPTRISFQVTSKIDSRTILGEQGAEHLLGQGDMLYMASGSRIIRVHGAFVSDQEIEKVVDFLRAQGDPAYVDMSLREEGYDQEEMDDEQDDLYRKAIDLIRRDGKVSTSYLQRQFQIGYNRAARLVERMENEGVVSPPNHVGKREIL